jgi:hypothetical protein
MVGVNLSREPTPDTCPGQISWHYDRAEIIADVSTLGLTS